MPEIPQVRTGCRPHAAPHPTAAQTRQLTRAAEHARQRRSPGHTLCREHYLFSFAIDREAPLNRAGQTKRVSIRSMTATFDCERSKLNEGILIPMKEVP